MDEPVLTDDPISYFKSNIQNSREQNSCTIFLGAPKPTHIGLWLIFCMALGFYFILSTFIGNILLIPLSIEGSSMYPTLNYEYSTTGNKYANDVVYLWKTQSFEYKDIIVFNAAPYTIGKNNNEPIYYIKRVIGTAGDTIQFIKTEENTTLGIAKYKLLKNGILLEENYISEEIVYHNSACPAFILNEKEIIIPDGYIFVMGDNRNNSKDSRDLGLISTSDILGKVVIHIPYGSTIIQGLIKSIKNDYLF